MFKRRVRRVGICISIAVLTLLGVALNQFTSMAQQPLGIGLLIPTQFDCSNFAFYGVGHPAGGFAAVRIWVNNVGGTPIVDSFVAGHPGYYTQISSVSEFNGAVSFPAQPNGTTLVARVYRALSAVPASWDAKNYIDTTITCKYGIHNLYAGLTCNFLQFSGEGSPGSGFAAVRIWVNSSLGPPLVDSYVAGHPSLYVPIPSHGKFYGAISFPAQPPGTTLLVRVYRALSAVPDSWDNSDVVNVSYACQVPSATLTPFP